MTDRSQRGAPAVARAPWFRTAVWASVAGLTPRRADYAGLARSWRRDLVAGLTVAVVALRLALAVGITTGWAPPPG
jgi:MFS superfamily sulfate permease-like transporter